METHLYLIRHGETDFNLQGIVQGRGVNTELNDTGQRQATALGQRFKDERVDSIYSSPLKRAYQTAQAVADACGIHSISTDPDLEEMSWGVFEGQSQSEELSHAFAEMKRRWHDGEHDFCVERGESLTQVQTRGMAAIQRIVQAENGKHIVVIAHGRFLRILLASLLEEYGIKRMEELQHSNTGVNLLIHHGCSYSAEYLNCTSHCVS